MNVTFGTLNVTPAEKYNKICYDKIASTTAEIHSLLYPSLLEHSRLPVANEQIEPTMVK